MTTDATGERPASPSDRPDAFYATLVGTYVALVVTPAILGGVARLRPGDDAALFGVLVVAVPGLVALTVRLVRSRRGFARHLGGRRAVFAFALLPVGPFVGYATLAETREFGGFGILGAFATLVAVLLGLVLVAMTRTRYTDAVVDGATIRAEWRAGWPGRARRRVRWASGLLIGSAPIGLLVALWTGSTVTSILGYAGIGLGSALSGVGSPRRYRATDVGLERSFEVHRSIHGWDAFEGYSETDDALVVHWRVPWRPAIRCARDQLDDPDAVRSALDRSLARVEYESF